tara:strand:- start:7635 stop:7778 length:144 start_codon:yes stop_codon:yes gene_type:complete
VCIPKNSINKSALRRKRSINQKGFEMEKTEPTDEGPRTEKERATKTH